MTNKTIPKEPLNFLGYVELHERMWGMETYPGRPTLEEILSAPVLALWYPPDEEEAAKTDFFKQERFTLTLHEDLQAIESYINRLIFRLSVKMPRQRLAKVFTSGKEVKMKSVSIVFEETL
jgi:hypothetical protein